MESAADHASGRLVFHAGADFTDTGNLIKMQIRIYVFAVVPCGISGADCSDQYDFKLFACEQADHVDEVFWLQYASILFRNVYAGAVIVEADIADVCVDHSSGYGSVGRCGLEQASGEKLGGQYAAVHAAPFAKSYLRH